MTDSVGQRYLHYKESDIFNSPLGSLRNMGATEDYYCKR